MITASAPGKCILLGEHSVVYGYPAIAVALDIHSYCTIEKPVENSIQILLPDYEMNLNFPNISHMQKHIPDMFRQFYEGLNAISKEYEIPIKNISFPAILGLKLHAGAKALKVFLFLSLLF